MADKIETDNKSIDKGMQESGTKASSLAGPTDADADDGSAFGSGALDATAFGMDKDPLPPGSGSSELAGDADDLELSRRLANDPTKLDKGPLVGRSSEHEAPSDDSGGLAFGSGAGIEDTMTQAAREPLVETTDKTPQSGRSEHAGSESEDGDLSLEHGVGILPQGLEQTEVDEDVDVDGALEQHGVSVPPQGLDQPELDGDF